ncbi:hypothetical protein EVAR_24153_1 [Eumeta japonica]|uniref:Uncharacterized protein n=1 Tax=Eumeta variegata TaxID=151549 RepID=A0A4C1YSX6_EUMVA|nr:hypothetical protein EVAR_24153_1 [Eumeta japonica]
MHIATYNVPSSFGLIDLVLNRNSGPDYDFGFWFRSTLDFDIGPVFSPGSACDSDSSPALDSVSHPNLALDSVLDSTLGFDPDPVFNFDTGPTLKYDRGLAFNSNSRYSRF